MTPEELHGQWHENKHRAAWVRRHRDAIREHTGQVVPRNLAGVEAYLEGHKSVISKRLNERVESDAAGSEEA